MAEGSPSYDDMTVRAFLSFIANVRGLTGAAARSKIDDVISKVSLEPVIDRPIDVLSKGFKRRVGLAQAILHDPPVLILDEPTDGLDPNQKHQVRSLIQDMAAEKAIIVSTHILEEVEAVCTRAVIIGSGKVLADGTSDQLLGMLPEHNAISVVMPSGTAEVATAQLKSLADVADVTQAPRPNGEVELRCLPKNGTEILDGVVGNLRANGIAYSQLYVNQSISPDNTGASGAGGTSIYGPRGVELAMAKSVYEQNVSAAIPIANFRSSHRLPDVPMALVMPVYEKYRVPIDPGLSLEYLPEDITDAARRMRETRNW
jgi:ABC-type multidrug transport system ATPase subunit